MSEWKLFAAGPPESREHLSTRGWMDLEHQPGWDQRSAMVTDLVRLVTGLGLKAKSITDLGCGDGALLAQLAPLGIPAWGYDLGAADVARGQQRGLDTREGDILAGGLEYGDLLIATEVAEHLADPVAFLSSLPHDRTLILSSPSLETGPWHNPIHAWAWDLAGYREMVERAGWDVIYQTDCDGGTNTFGGVTGPQRFQAVVAVR